MSRSSLIAAGVTIFLFCSMWLASHLMEIHQEEIAYWKYRLTHERQHESALPVVYTVARMELKGE